MALVLVAGVSVGAAVLLPDDASGPAPLTVSGNLLQANGERVVLTGASAYLLPFYRGDGEGGRDIALQETTERSYRQRIQMLDHMRENHVNTLRVPVSLTGYEQDIYELGGQQAYLERLRGIVAAAADRDIRVVVGWWDSHAQGAEWLQTYRDVLPMMADVRAALEPWPSVVYEPFNEPHDVTWEQWEPVMRDVVSFWRDDLDYDGVLLIDTIDYSWNFDPQAARRLLDHDADLRGDAAAIVFANHRYANDNICFCDDERAEWEEVVGQHVDEFPIIGTEYGRWTGPDFQPQDRWNAEFAEHVSTTAVPAGLNGYLAFVWDWVDENSMTERDGSELNAYGRLITDEVFAKHDGRSEEAQDS